jgi:hypothetical protein
MRGISELVRYKDIHGHTVHYLTFKPPCWHFNVKTWFVKNITGRGKINGILWKT